MRAGAALVCSSRTCLAVLTMVARHQLIDAMALRMVSVMPSVLHAFADLHCESFQAINSLLRSAGPAEQPPCQELRPCASTQPSGMAQDEAKPESQQV